MSKPSKQEIWELRDWLVQVYHKNKVKEQEVDQNYIDDKFKIDYMPEGVTQINTGKAFRMVSAPAEHIITSSPVLYREPKGKGELQAQRIASEGNRWLGLMLRQNPQPLKEHVKKILGKGEAWIYTPHNDSYNPNDINDMPVNFLVPDPTIVFVDPYAGERNGVPNRLIVSTKRVAWQVREDYPIWRWRAKTPEDTFNSLVDFTMYFDNDYRYFEAAKESLFYETDGDGRPVIENGEAVPYGGDGVQENYYGFVPFVHCYSGFGEGSADGDPSSLAVSRIRHCRDLIAEQTAIRSTINNITFKYAEPPIDYYYNPEGGFTPNPSFKTEYSRAPGAFNEVPVTPGITEPIRKGVDKLPEPQLFEYLFNIERAIDEEDPLGGIAEVRGTSGRQDIRAEGAALRRYDTVVENSAHAWEQAFGLAFRQIEKMPSLKPSGLNKGDIGKSYEVRIELKAEDPIANQIKSADGDRKWQAGIIDLETNLTEYQGYSQDEAQRIIGKRLADDVTLNDPVVRRVLGIDAVTEMGMEDKFAEVEAQLAEEKKSLLGRGISTSPDIGAEGGEPRVNNVKTQLGREQPDLSKALRPTRRSPL